MNEFTHELASALSGYYESFVHALPRLAVALLTLFIFIFIARKSRRWLIPRLTRSSSDSLLTGFLADLGYWVVLILGISVALSAVGLDGAVTKILAGAGLSAFILGFALKDIGENFLAGILLAFKRPFRIGDLVETQGVHGRIIDMNLRETIIKTLDGKDVYVPNGGILKNPLYNYSVDDFLRLEFCLNLENQEGYEQAIPLIKKALKTTNGVLHEATHAPTVSIEQTDANALVAKVEFWINSARAEMEAPAIKTEAIQQVMAALKAQGYSLAKTNE